MTDTLGVLRYRHPHTGRWGRALEAVAACRWWSRLRRAALSRLPFVTLESDVRDVVYLNWLVEVSRLAHMVPPGLHLWQRHGRTVLTVLTYRHGGFGPAVAGSLRRGFGSPLQSNWRLYMDETAGMESAPAGPTSVLFVCNQMDSATYALGGRLFSDALPTHLAAAFEHDQADGHYRTDIDPGAGNGCALRYGARRCADALPAGFGGIFADTREAIRVLARQDRALVPCVDGSGLAMAGIDLPVPVDEACVLELTGPVHAPAVAQIIADAPIFCFAVPRVRFRVLWEKLR